MVTTEHITPSVMIDGQPVAIEGWMITLACAFKGFSWAIEEASKPEFLEMVRDYERRKNVYWLKREIDASEDRLTNLKEKLKTLCH